MNREEGRASWRVASAGGAVAGGAGVIKAVRRAKLFVFLRLHRHELFDRRTELIRCHSTVCSIEYCHVKAFRESFGGYAGSWLRTGLLGSARVRAHRWVAARSAHGPRGQGRRPRTASPSTPVRASPRSLVSPSTPVIASPASLVTPSPGTPVSPSPSTPLRASSGTRLSADRSPSPGAVSTPGTCRISRCRTLRPSWAPCLGPRRKQARRWPQACLRPLPGMTGIRRRRSRRRWPR